MTDNKDILKDKNAYINADDSFYMPKEELEADEIDISKDYKCDYLPKTLKAERIKFLYNESIKEINSDITAGLLSLRGSKVDSLKGNLNIGTLDVCDSQLKEISGNIAVSRKMKVNQSIEFNFNFYINSKLLYISDVFDVRSNNNILEINGDVTLSNIKEWGCNNCKLKINGNLTLDRIQKFDSNFLNCIESVSRDILLKSTKVIGSISHIKCDGEIKCDIFSDIINS